MNILFVHQNLPSQYTHLLRALAAEGGHRIAAITQNTRFAPPGVQVLTYAPTRLSTSHTHHYVRLYENAVLAGQEVARRCMQLRAEGFRPDVILAHPGWGEALFLKDVFPRARVLNYCEFYYHGSGADVGFDPEDGAGLDAVCRARARNAHLLLSLESCDAGVSPTRWQRAQHPAPLRDKIAVVFDGIDTDRAAPDPAARLRLPDGRTLTGADRVVTYVARNLEPYRGFRSFMRAVPAILARDPEAHVVIVGGDGVSYGRAPPQGGTWRQAMLDEIGAVDLRRVHMLGVLGYADYLTVLQVSRAHVYLTVPFVLSWSCMEALSCGALVIGSDTAPVAEVIAHGQNGMLVDFFAPAAIADAVAAALAAPHEALRHAARGTVLDNYSLRACLPRQLELIRRLA